MRKIAVFVLLLSLVWVDASRAVAAPDDRPVPQIRRVLIISIDGLRPDLLLRANTPNLHDLFTTGTYSFWARTTAASTTLPSHVSMLTGVVPEAHAIMWNADLPLERPVHPYVPTLFELAKKAGYTTALAAGKSKFDVLNKPGTIDWTYFPSTSSGEDQEVTAQAGSILRQHRPDVMVVHLPSVDITGHGKGWGSPEQIAAIEQADACVGQLLAALDELELRSATMILITADHGGAGRTHGPDDPRSRTIPWIVNGAGIRKNFDLTRLPDLDIETFDTFTTSCHMLGIRIERRVRGKFVSQILDEQELLQSPAEPAREPGALPAMPKAPVNGER